jgi:hypothetical protein
MNPLIIAGAVALIGFLAAMAGKAGADEGAVIINGNGGAGNGNGNGNGGAAPAPAPVLTATLNLETK